MAARMMSQKQYARHRGCSPQHINRLVREGRIALNREGKIDADRADRALGQPKLGPAKSGTTGRARGANVRKPATGSQSGRKPGAQLRLRSLGRAESATSSLTAARARKALADARLSELDAEERAGQLLRKEEVLAAQRQQNANVRTRLRQLPRAMAQELAAVASPAEIERLLLAYIDRQLADLAADPLSGAHGSASPPGDFMIDHDRKEKAK